MYFEFIKFFKMLEDGNQICLIPDGNTQIWPTQNLKLSTTINDF